MNEEREKYTIVSRLLNLEEPDDIAQDMGISKNKVRRINREFQREQRNGNLQNYLNLDDAMLEEINELIQSGAHEGIEAEVASTLDSLKEAKSDMNRLREVLEKTAIDVVTRIKCSAVGATHSELDLLVDSIVKINDSFFNPKQTQVNVQNNFETPSTSYSAFLNDKPKDN